MNQFKGVLIYLVLVVFFDLLLMGHTSQAQIVLKMNHQFPETTVGSTIDQWFSDQIYRATNGEVKIRIFWSNGLAGPKENLSLLKTGAIDMAAMSAGYFPNQLSFYAAPNSIPMGMDNICQSSAIMKAFLDQVPAFGREAGNHNIKPLFFHLLNPYLLITQKPVTRFSDLKGLRIRTWGDDMPRLMAAAGAKPVPLFLPDIYQAMKHGVIDGCPFSLDLAVSYKIYELAGHITKVVLWEGPSWGVWISEKTWEKLSPRTREIFLETAERAREIEIPKTREAEKKAENFLKNKGVKFHSFAPSELMKWKNESPDFFEDLINRMAEKGEGKDAIKMVRIWKKMRDRITCP